MLTLNQLLIVIGLLAAYLINLAFAGSGNWRAMFWIGAVPAAMLVLASLRLPESPAWLFAHGDVDEAKAMIAPSERGTSSGRAEPRSRRGSAVPATLERRGVSASAPQG